MGPSPSQALTIFFCTYTSKNIFDMTKQSEKKKNSSSFNQNTIMQSLILKWEYRQAWEMCKFRSLAKCIFCSTWEQFEQGLSIKYLSCGCKAKLHKYAGSSVLLSLRVCLNWILHCTWQNIYLTWQSKQLAKAKLTLCMISKISFYEIYNHPKMKTQRNMGNMQINFETVKMVCIHSSSQV